MDGFNWGQVVPPPTQPPTTLWPTNSRTELIVDVWRVMLADPDGNIIGLPSPYPLSSTLTANRAGTRNL